MKQFTPLDAMRERAERAERELAALKTELSVPSAERLIDCAPCVKAGRAGMRCETCDGIVSSAPSSEAVAIEQLRETAKFLQQVASMGGPLSGNAMEHARRCLVTADLSARPAAPVTETADDYVIARKRAAERADTPRTDTAERIHGGSPLEVNHAWAYARLMERELRKLAAEYADLKVYGRTRSATALTRAELDALIDFHDYNDAGAEAMDCVEQSKYHAERSKHYAALRDALPPADSGSDKGAP